jgi:WD40 repeat protein
MTVAKEKAILRGHRDSVRSVAFSGDAKLLASGGDDNMVRLWDVATGKEKATLLGQKDNVAAVAFSGDRKLLASVGIDGTVRLWDVAAVLKAAK